MITIGRAYQICKAAGFEGLRFTPRTVQVRGYGEWPLIGFLRLAEALLRERYQG